MIKDNGIEIFTSKELMPSERAIKQLGKIALDERVKKPVLGLVDIHDKKGNDFPTGVVAASSTHIFPQLMVSGPNCGMCMITTPILKDGFGEKDIDNLYDHFSKELYISSFLGERLSGEDIVEVIMSGASWVGKMYPDSKVDVKSIELQGNAFSGIHINEKIIREAIPESIINLSRHRMGILGKGNHFLELQVVEKIFDERIAESFSIRENGLCFLLHSGSGGFGAIVSHLYSPKTFASREIKMHAFIIAEWFKSIGKTKRRRYIKKMYAHALKKGAPLFGLEEGSDLADIYLAAIRASSNFAYANRAFISMRAKNVIARECGTSQDELKTLYDLSHMSINREKHDNDSLWVHRTGGISAFSARALPDDSPFKQTGTPILLPGSMGDATYVCVSTDDNKRTYYSASHGAGRLSEDSIGKKALNRSELVDYLRDNSVKLYNGYSKNIIKQDPRCFKNIDKTISYLEEDNLVSKVAKLKPVAVLKG